MWELTLTHAIDGEKSARLAMGNIIRAPVPAGFTPAVKYGGGTGGGKEIYNVTTGGMRLYLRAEPSQTAKGLHAYRPNTEVTVLDNTAGGGKWYEVITPDGRHGYMWAENLTYVRTEGSAEAAAESIREAKALRDQPFRIYKIVPGLDCVTVYARHIFYDLADNLLGSCKIESQTGAVAAAAILSSCRGEAGAFRIYSDLNGEISADWSDKTPVEATFGSEGLTELTGGEIARDWWDIYAVKRVGRDGGVTVRQGKNLKSLGGELNISDVATRIVPIGTDADGSALYLPEGYIDSKLIDSYPLIKWARLDVREAQEVKSGKNKRTKEECYELMRAAAQARFDAGCDGAAYTLDIDFVNLADTDEYAAYAGVSDLALGDSVHVIAKSAGVDVAMRLTDYVYDCLAKRYKSVSLGALSATMVSSTLSAKQLPAAGVTGAKIAPGAVDARALQDGAVGSLKIALAAINYAHINQAAVNQLSADSLTAQIAHINALSADTIDADELTAAWAKMYAIIAENIEAGTIAAGTITAAMAKLSGASIQRADIDFAQIRQMKAGTAVADQLITHDAVADRYFIDKLQVRALQVLEQTVGSLIVKAKDGGYYRLDIDPGAGTVVPTPVSPSGGEKAAGVTGDKSRCIIETDLTVSDLAASNVKAINALIDRLTASRIEVDTLFAREATVGALNAYLLKAETIEALQGQLNIWASDKITTAVSGIEIGGTNLLYCSADMGYSNSRGFLFNSAGAATVGTAGEAGSDGSRLVTNANSNLRFYHTRLAVTAGETFTISAEYKIVSGSPDIKLQLSFYKTATDWTSAGAFADTGTETALGDGWVRRSFTATAPAGSVTLMPFWRSGADNASFTHSYYIRHPKLERGNKATGWRQNPEELRIGSSVLMDAQHVEINAPYLDINVSGTAGDMHIDEDGVSGDTGTFEHFTCPEVMKNYAGNMTLAANSDVSVIGAALNNKCLTGSMTITLNGDVNGLLEIRGVVGRGNVTINGNGHTLNGHIWLNNNAVHVVVNNLTVSATGSQRGCVYISICRGVALRNCVFNSNSLSTSAGTSQGVRVYYSSLLMQNCEFYNTVDYNMVFGACADVAVQNCKGDGGKCVYTDGASVKWSGTRPSGTWGKGIVSLTAPADLTTLTINTGSATPTETPVTTARYTASVTGTYYPSGHWIGNSGLIQGRYDTTRHYGCMWFAASALKGKTIKSATLTIKRIAGAGKSSSVNVTLYTSPVTGKSGNPTTNAVSLGTLGKAGNGETVIVNLPTSAIAAIASGGALMLDPGDTANASNKRYSANYARFEGKDDGTPPVLTVTYQ